jgi:nucleotide-binding universal stress UspA family protein
MDQTNQNPGLIVCATRGGEGSEPTIQKAIQLARERGCRLTFLYIADVDFMKYTTLGRTDLAAEEVSKMGEFIMLTFAERAREEGIEANCAVRKAHFREGLLRYLEETRPATLVLGSSKPGTAYLDAGKLDKLKHEIEGQTGVSVELV